MSFLQRIKRANSVQCFVLYNTPQQVKRVTEAKKTKQRTQTRYDMASKLAFA